MRGNWWLLGRLRWELRRLWERLDVFTLMALAAFSLWLGLHFTVNAPLSLETQRLAQQVDLQQQTLALRQPSRGTSNSVRSSDELVAFFPPSQQREHDLLRLHQLALKQGLAVVRADYRSSPLVALLLQRFSLRLQLQGSYVQQRLFLQALLLEFPHMAVERLSVEGSAVTAGKMTALLEAQLYYQPGQVQGGRK